MRNLVEQLIRRMARGTTVARSFIMIPGQIEVNGEEVPNTIDNAAFNEYGLQLINTTVALFAAQLDDSVILSPYRFSEYTFPNINFKNLLRFSTRNGYTSDTLRRGDQLFYSALDYNYNTAYVVSPTEYSDIWTTFLESVRFNNSSCSSKLSKLHMTMKDVYYIYTTDNVQNRTFYQIVEGDDDKWQTAYGLGLNAPLLPLAHMGVIQGHIPTVGEFMVWAQTQGKVLNDNGSFHKPNSLGQVKNNNKVNTKKPNNQEKEV